MPARVPDAHAGGPSGSPAEEIVITGLSGRLPESNSIEEFKQQLFDGVDLVSGDERRWPTNLYGLPARTGKLKDLAHFDAQFFGVHAKQAHVSFETALSFFLRSKLSGRSFHRSGSQSSAFHGSAEQGFNSKNLEVAKL